MYLAAPNGVVVFLGSVTMSGLATAAVIALVLGIRGSDRINLRTKEKTGFFALVTGWLMIDAGGEWASIAQGISSVPTNTLRGNLFGDPGLGGVCIILTILIFCPKWKRMVWPALLGIAAGVVYGEAGGVWAIFSNLPRDILALAPGMH